MKNGEKYTRKEFLKTVFWSSLALSFFQFCEIKSKTILLKITGTNHILGHKLWAKNFPNPTGIFEKKILIIGGGISGLSAARYLSKSGENDFSIIEMEDKLGGNSKNGENQWSKYPLGAHYLPFPNKEDKLLIDFLEECKIILGYDGNNNPILDEEQITFPKTERLFYQNKWDDNIIPKNDFNHKVNLEIDAFFKLMQFYREKKDSKGKFWFDIPLENSSKDEEITKLDKITFKQWLDIQNFKSEELTWLLNYSCRDDFGLGIDFVSAWAGIHYFAGRKHNFAKNYHAEEFTWPEGNARLVEYLFKYSKSKKISNHLVFDCKIIDNKIVTLAYDNNNKTTKKFISDKVIFCTPQYVNKHIFKDKSILNICYVPWFIATITFDKNFLNIEDFAWDNVIYNGLGLGYIYNQHQHLNQINENKVISYYYSFNDIDTNKSREKLYHSTEEELKSIVISDLKKAHHYIEEHILNIEFHKLGHGMICPIPNYIHSENLKTLNQSIDNKIFFAHSDLTGISIFEEAFHQGIKAAKNILS